jgi:glycerol-3-phosphate dehydrogenase (NAD+)
MGADFLWIAAIMRIGLLELKDFCLEFFPSTRASTFLEESCGVADIMTSCVFLHSFLF